MRPLNTLSRAQEALPQMRESSVRKRPLSDQFQRFFDIAGAITVLLPSALVFILVALLIKLSDGGPVFFRQERLGLGGKTFWMIKLRTMIVGAEHVGAKLRVQASDPRITRIGRWLREFHLDELPQFLNVLKGDMSIVGPRPAVPMHKPYYETWECVRLAVRPGITGLAQVSGGNAITWDDRILIDVYFVHKRGLRLYFEIILLTVLQLFTKTGIYTNEGTVQGWTRGLPKWYEHTTPTIDAGKGEKSNDD